MGGVVFERGNRMLDDWGRLSLLFICTFAVIWKTTDQIINSLILCLNSMATHIVPGKREMVLTAGICEE